MDAKNQALGVVTRGEVLAPKYGREEVGILLKGERLYKVIDNPLRWSKFSVAS